MTVAIELAAVVVLILLNAFFVAGEDSLVTVRRPRVKQAAGADGPEAPAWRERPGGGGQPRCPLGPPDHERPAALHRRDAARRHAHLAGHPRPGRARARRPARRAAPARAPR